MKHRKVLIFATHQDDEALIAGGMIAKQNKCKVVSSCYTDQAREKIFYHNSRCFGYDADCLGLNDCSLNLNIDRLATMMIEEIGKYDPDIIISNHFIDVHQDHVANSQAFTIATKPIYRKKDAVVLYGYGVSLYENSHLFVSPNSFIELTRKELDFKIAMMKNYKKELRKCRNETAIENHAKMSGLIFGVRYAEVYYQTNGEIK